MKRFDPKVPEAKQGLYRKYSVRRLGDKRRKHADCEYYVLDLHHDPFAAAALRAYAKACFHEFPQLAEDLTFKAFNSERRTAKEPTEPPTEPPKKPEPAPPVCGTCGVPLKRFHGDAELSYCPNLECPNRGPSCGTGKGAP